MRSKSRLTEMHFSTSAQWIKDKEGRFSTTESKESFFFSCPVDLGGINTPSPEDLFISAIGACTITTLLHICDSLHTTPEELVVDTSADLKLQENSKFEFENIKCNISLVGDEFLLERACEIFPKHCVVSNAIIPNIEYVGTINSEKTITFMKSDFNR
ncbi:MAG: OsmC family protein [Candidatus Hodarchaeales archaeon]